jgi:hypothetical protein
MKTFHLRAAVLALFALPAVAQAQAWVTFSSAGELPMTLTDPVATEGSRQIDDAYLAADYFASASLSSGILRAQVAGTPKIVFTSSPVAQSQAEIRDRFQIVGPGTTPVPLQFRMDIGATMTVDPTLGADALASLYLGAVMSIDGYTLGSMEIQRTKTTNEFGAPTQDYIQCVGQPCDLNQPLTLAGVVDGQLVVDLALSPGFSYTFDAFLQVSTYSTPGALGEVDASHTARLSYTLPAGYTLASQSGVFLSAVPEPQSWALWAAGLLSIAALRARAWRADGHA